MLRMACHLHSCAQYEVAALEASNPIIRGSLTRAGKEEELPVLGKDAACFNGIEKFW